MEVTFQLSFEGHGGFGAVKIWGEGAAGFWGRQATEERGRSEGRTAANL